MATLSEVDQTTKAVGRLIPDGQVKAIQSFESGIISEILVHEGDQVQAANILVRLDPTDVIADEQRTWMDLAVSRVELARLEATINNRGIMGLESVADMPQFLLEAAELLMRQQADQLNASILSIDASIREQEANIESILVLIEKSKELLPIALERERISQDLYSKSAGTKLSYFDDRERSIGLRNDIRNNEAKLAQARGSLESLRQSREVTILKFQTDRRTELVEAHRRVLIQTPEYLKTKERLKRFTIVAPLAGTVQDMTIYTIGGVIKSGDRLMTIVPKESKLIAEAFISNKDIGFVSAGQDVDVRVAAFDYRLYGSIKGKIKSISRDASIADNAIQNRPPIAPTKSQTDPASSPVQEGPGFRAQISLENAAIRIGEEDVELTSGMGVEVNILGERRRIIDFFLQPMQTYRYEAFRQ
jgi:hemolysin D